jgi:hypothetical protein
MADNIEDVLGLARSEQPELPSDDSMAELSQSVQALVEIRGYIDDAEATLKDLKAKEQKLSTEIIPSKMDEIGFTSVTMPDGHKVGYAPFYSGKIKPETEPEAFDWIEENGHGGVIKGELVIPYRRPQRDKASELQKAIKDNGWECTVKLGVHHSTLRALIREVVEDGSTFPPDLFDIFIGRKTTIK